MHWTTSGVVQVTGYMDDLVDSEHFVVHEQLWPEVRDCRWLEVVDLDDYYLWRITGSKASREVARVTKPGTALRMLYLACFTVTDLDRRFRGGTTP